MFFVPICIISEGHKVLEQLDAILVAILQCLVQGGKVEPVLEVQLLQSDLLGHVRQQLLDGLYPVLTHRHVESIPVVLIATVEVPPEDPETDERIDVSLVGCLEDLVCLVQVLFLNIEVVALQYARHHFLVLAPEN